MTISIVLRLSPVAIGAHRLAGEVEVVATGERRLISSVDELVSFLADQLPERAGQARPVEPAEAVTRSRGEAGGNGQ